MDDPSAPARAGAPPARAAAYFERLGPARFRATDLVGGAWEVTEQHVAPVMGLLTHVVEVERGEDGLSLVRLSFDVLGTLPVGEVDVDVAVLRPGRTVELVEARVLHGGRTALLLRAWRARSYDTAAIAATPLARIAPPERTPAWDPRAVWPGGFIASIEARRAQVEPGRAASWVRTHVPLLAGEDVSPTARALGLVDLANGVAARAAPGDVAFPNLDLTAHLFTAPRGEWLGLDTSVSFGPAGLGLTRSTLHDVHGPVGAVEQCLTVRPRAR